MFNRTFLPRKPRGMQVTQSHPLHFLPTGGRVNDCGDTYISRGPLLNARTRVRAAFIEKAHAPHPSQNRSKNCSGYRTLRQWHAILVAKKKYETPVDR